MSGGLSWRHHAIIQALLSRGPLKEHHFHSIFEQLTNKNPAGSDRKLFDGFISKINKALMFINFELRACIDQYDGQVYYGVVNSVSDEQSKLGTKYSVPQIAFYKAIIEAIVQDAAAKGVLSSIEALNLDLDSQVTVVTDPQSQESQPVVPAALKNFSHSQKEKTLDELARDQWLNLTADGNIKLGVKSFLDLRRWFQHNDIPSCQVCNEAGVKAELCQNEDCTVRIHHYCLKKHFLRRKVLKDAKVCPSCGTSWPYTIPKAEAVATEDENEAGGSQQATSSRQKRRTTNRVDGDEAVGSHNHGDGSAPKRSKVLKTEDSNAAGRSRASQSSTDMRRVTRSSARLH